ncbi:hypothetical protein GOB86_13600 [Acetobacter lambici]|uniref:Tail fiber protein n=1 Tax=Acetobacter lambici TaxID=1332824 RepID=A0ABT1F423_9PROT|nr:hypothetical protein [Acetobacter lambici]MCP1243842.1 hypothetical protein [Acetobacter lambici]MCP1259950.1 hypothetical protein [Acetobacter lambici]NHO58065.1 hypothetical protein [Acetobacter lambici]
MKKVDSNNGVWVNDDPATLTNGTPIDADVMNNIQDEISNVITDNGNTLDGTNHSQLSQTLDKTFAKINSPTLTGIPLTSNPDGTINNQIATVDYVNQKALQATVGFTPTQQGGGTDQGANKVYIGGDSTDATQARVQIDQTDLGKISFQAEDNNTYGVSKIGYDHTKNELAYYDTGNKAWHYSYTTDYIDGKAYISSLPTGDNTKVTDIIWNTSSNLPAYYYGADNQVSYSATTDWSKEQFLQLADTDTQTVSTPVVFSGANKHSGAEAFTGVTTVPSVAAFTGKDALNAETAEGRYIKSAPDAGSGDVRITGIVGNAASGLVVTDSNGDTTVFNPVSQGVYPDGTLWREIGGYRELWFSLTTVRGGFTSIYTYPVAFSEAPSTILTARDAGGVNHIGFADPAGSYPTANQTQGLGMGSQSGAPPVFLANGSTVNFYLRGKI